MADCADPQVGALADCVDAEAGALADGADPQPEAMGDTDVAWSRPTTPEIGARVTAVPYAVSSYSPSAAGPPSKRTDTTASPPAVRAMSASATSAS